MQAFFGDLPVITMGTSMGCPIEVLMAHHNFFDNPENGRLNIVGQLWNAPALVPPHRIVPDMAFKFLPSIPIGLGKELLLKSNPKEIYNVLKNGIIDSGFSKKDVPIMWHQIYELLRGTPESQISDVIAVAPAVVLTGEKDPLNQTAMYERLKAEHGDNLLVEVIPGRGHEIPMKPNKNIAKLRKASALLVREACSQPNIESLSVAA
jgi:hypothetical protein